ncbi:MAG: CIA30 family protein [Planctomycetota bacterium]|jgi:monofunctional biosynthetic peptidoglycan transglycosylase
MTASLMLPTLLSALALMLPPVDLTPRLQAAAKLEDALERATSAEGNASETLGVGVEAARQALGPESEVANELGELQIAARFQALFAEDGGASWLAPRLAQIVSDLRFEPVREAALPAGFPDARPVGEIRIQHYPTYRAAYTETRDATGESAFWTLFTHIQNRDIAMTAPVETTFGAERTELAESGMAFLYASTALGRTGAQGAVEVVDVPALSAVSIGMRGVRSLERIEDARRKLERWIDERPGWRRSGSLRTMEYNSPMVRGERRYFEVQIPVTPSTEIVIDFADPSEAERWQAVDDVVMGGQSSSRLLRTTEGTALFTGELSLENNGGFASVRTAGERCSLADATSVILRVRGDGKSYRLRCRVATPRGEISYQSTFPTRSGEWLNVELPLADFEPRWRGRLITGAPARDPAAVRGFGLMIGDKQDGSFRLELQSLAKVRVSGSK